MIILFTFIFFFYSLQLFSAAKEAPTTPVKERTIHFVTPSKTEFGTTISHDYIGSLQEIIAHKKSQDSVEIYVNAFFLTHVDFAQALADVKNELGEKATIVVLIDSLSKYHSKKILPLLTEAQIPVFAYESNFFKATDEDPLHLNHCKYLIWKYKSSKKRDLYRLASGSANFTVLGSEEGNNLEHFMIAKSSKKEFKQLKNLMFMALDQATKLNDAAKEFELPEAPEAVAPTPLHKTPTKGYVTQASPVDNIEQAMIDRINKTSAKGEITIITYSFDLPHIVDALEEALKRGCKLFLVVDIYSRKRKKSTADNSLKRLAQYENGHIWIYKDQGIKKNHSKLLLINDGKRIVAGHGSYNLSSSSQNSFNVFHWFAKTSAAQVLNLIVEQWPTILKKCTLFKAPRTQAKPVEKEVLFAAPQELSPYKSPVNKKRVLDPAILTSPRSKRNLGF